MAIKDFSLRIEEDLLAKLRYVAKYHDRSANGELLFLIRKHVKSFEKENGEIELPQAQDSQ